MRSRTKTVDKKWIALIALVVQNSGLSIVMRYSLVDGDTDSKSRYMTSTAVLMSEFMKLLIATTACFLFDSDASFSRFKNLLKTDANSDWLKLLVPSVLYTVQNSLQYAAMGELSAPVFQVLYQMKIITTAIFSVLLGRHITGMQWGAVIALTLGVAMVQVSQRNMEEGGSNSFMGIVYVACGCITSGFAGVYFEMILKGSNASIWIRNIQLSFIGIFIASIGCFMRDSDRIASEGFFFGYNELVWGTIALQAAGGLIVAIVVKYADNVIKNFATSLSIILSAVVSEVLFKDLAVNTSFIAGAGIV